MTAISTRARITKPGRPTWSKKPVLGIAPPMGVPNIISVEAICCVCWACTVGMAAGPVIGAKARVARLVAIIAVGLLIGLMVATTVFVGTFGGSEDDVARAACAVEVTCMATAVWILSGVFVGSEVGVSKGARTVEVFWAATAVWLLSGIFEGSDVGVHKAACAVEVICATTCAFPERMAAWVAFCEAV